MTFCAIHISDLHFKPEWDEEVDLIANKFFDDLGGMASRLDDPYLIFSGDLVNAGSEKSFYEKFIEAFGAKLDEIGIDFDHRICVPGNHDVSRAGLEGKLTTHISTLESIKNESQFNNEVTAIGEMFLRDKFLNYLQCESTFAKYTTCQNDIAGQGWDIDETFGIYCLNSALCSTGGLKPSNEPTWNDKGKLHIGSRQIHRWISQSSHKYRILICHHPFDWLKSWAQSEIESTVYDAFDLVLSGHIHSGIAGERSRPAGSYIDCSAPPLFTRKSNPALGYSLIQVDGESLSTSVEYRQWSANGRKFVTGSLISGTDDGRVVFTRDNSGYEVDQLSKLIVAKQNNAESLLRSELEEALTCHASSRQIWVDRELSSKSDIHKTDLVESLHSVSEFAKDIKSCVIKAPKEFGLSSIGKFIAYNHFVNSGKKSLAITVDALQIASHRRGVIEDITKRCEYFGFNIEQLNVIIIDNWVTDSQRQKVLKIILKEYPEVKVVVTEGTDESNNLLHNIYFEELENFDTYYLKPLSRERIRELAEAYAEEVPNLDGETLTKKSSRILMLSIFTERLSIVCFYLSWQSSHLMRAL